MVPKVLAWDKNYASAHERELAYEANIKSGIPALVEAAKKDAAFYGKPLSEVMPQGQMA